MTVILVNDASCLIDLSKGHLLEAMLRLPYRFLVPHPIRTDELLTVDGPTWRRLEASGLEVYDLTPTEVSAAIALRGDHPALSAYDCLVLATALGRKGTMILTGDAALRKAALSKGVATHGVLWVWDRLVESGHCPTATLRAAITRWQADPSVFLPPAALVARRERIG